METIEETRVQVPYHFRKKAGPQTIYARNYTYRAKKTARVKKKVSSSQKPTGSHRRSFIELAQKLQLDATFQLSSSPGEVSVETVQRALDTALAIYGDSYIQSNYIESINGKVKQFLSTRGIRNTKHLEAKVAQLFLTKPEPSVSSRRKYHFSMKQLACGLSACL